MLALIPRSRGLEKVHFHVATLVFGNHGHVWYISVTSKMAAQLHAGYGSCGRMVQHHGCYG